jgi:hypothetical protein
MPRKNTKRQMPPCLILSHLASLKCRMSLIRLTFVLRQGGPRAFSMEQGRNPALAWSTFVERSRYAAARTGLVRLRTWHAGGLVLHWPLTLPSTGCRRLAVHDARQTVNNNL